jgi:hypothetical protein
VRIQWKVIDKLWENDCLASLSLIVGHVSDDDFCRKQLVLEYFKNVVSVCLEIGWEG